MLENGAAQLLVSQLGELNQLRLEADGEGGSLGEEGTGPIVQAVFAALPERGVAIVQLFRIDRPAPRPIRSGHRQPSGKVTQGP